MEPKVESVVFFMVVGLFGTCAIAVLLTMLSISYSKPDTVEVREECDFCDNKLCCTISLIRLTGEVTRQKLCKKHLAYVRGARDKSPYN